MPATTALALEIFATTTGEVLSEVLPSPSCAWLFLPQQRALPSLSAAQLCKDPAPIPIALLIFETLTGDVLPLVEPFPN